ncbi:hypothetical protein [Mesorhizobium sp. ES1-1]|nr:hypothetical protein [Mesorhizobium sp. ES1-1]MBZ9674232.1 hypothetical protein [Mesorhizobium sp. ES1-1]
MIDNAAWPDRRGTFTGFLSKVYPVAGDRNPVSMVAFMEDDPDPLSKI